MKSSPRFAALMALVVGLAVSGQARADCTKDTECKGDRVCQKGRCVDAPAGPAGRCSVDTDCPGNQVCTDGKCAASAAPPPAAPPPALAPPPLAVAPPPAAVALPPAAVAPPPGYAPAAPPYAPYAPYAGESGARLEEMPYAGGPIPPGMHVEQRRRMGLLKAGAWILGAGYLLAVIGSTAYGAIGGGRTEQAQCFKSSTWALGYLPVLGPLALTATFPSGTVVTSETGTGGQDCSSYFAATAAWGTIDSLLQSAGLSLLIAGAAAKSSVLVPDPAVVRVGRAHLRIVPGAPGAIAGATLSLLDF
jgi:hypothetical protein